MQKATTSRDRNHSVLILEELITVAGDHQSRWRQVFEILEEALGREEEIHGGVQLRGVREMLTGRAI